MLRATKQVQRDILQCAPSSLAGAAPVAAFMRFITTDDDATAVTPLFTRFRVCRLQKLAPPLSFCTCTSCTTQHDHTPIDVLPTKSNAFTTCGRRKMRHDLPSYLLLQIVRLKKNVRVTSNKLGEQWLTDNKTHRPHQRLTYQKRVAGWK